jgi:hypothetical protein
MPAYTTPMLGQMRDTFSMIESSTRGEGDFREVAKTIPLVAMIVTYNERWIGMDQIESVPGIEIGAVVIYLTAIVPSSCPNRRCDLKE